MAAKRQNLPSLTGARWWAAMAVFVLHALVFLAVYPFQHTELFARIHKAIPMQLGSAGVTFFFVLSGFLIYWSNSNVRGVSQVLYYCRRRVTKIYPMHLICLGLFILGTTAVSTQGVEWALDFSRLELWLPNALLIHTWNPDWAVLGGMNVPAWSLGAEMLFYFSFPLLVPVMARVHGRGNWVALFGLYALTVLSCTAIHFLAEGPKDTANFFVPRLWEQETSPIAEPHASPVWFAQEQIPVTQSYWLSYYFPPTRLAEFYLGAFMAKLVAEQQFRNTKLTWPLLALALSYAATWFVPLSFKMSVLMLLPMTVVVGTLACRDLAGKSHHLATPRAVLFGNISFAFYLVQFPVMVFAQRYIVVGKSWGFWQWLGIALACFICSVVLSWILFTFVDDPLMKATARKRGQSAPKAKENVLRRDLAIIFGPQPGRGKHAVRK